LTTNVFLIQRPKATRYFRDGVRYIDYVLTYEEEEEGEEKEKRDVFEANLMKKGLQLEHAPKEVSDHGSKMIKPIVYET